MLKSAYEIAMERTGGSGPSLTEEQKAALASIDARYQSKIVERDFLHSQRVQKARLDGDEELAGKITAEFHAERERLEAARDREKDRIRSGKGA